MKVNIDKDERYPDYFVTDRLRWGSVDVDQATLDRVKAAFEEYEAVQDILAELHGRQTK